MTVTIRLSVETDLHCLAKILTVGELPANPRPWQVRAAVGAVLARDGLHGALRRYHRQLRELTHADDIGDHETHLGRCRILAAQAFPPPKPRRRPPRSAPVGPATDRRPGPRIATTRRGATSMKRRECTLCVRCTTAPA